jgi:hypothetical protein
MMWLNRFHFCSLVLQETLKSIDNSGEYIRVQNMQLWVAAITQQIEIIQSYQTQLKSTNHQPMFRPLHQILRLQLSKCPSFYHSESMVLMLDLAVSYRKAKVFLEIFQMLVTTQARCPRSHKLEVSRKQMLSSIIQHNYYPTALEKEHLATHLGISRKQLDT